MTNEAVPHIEQYFSELTKRSIDDPLLIGLKNRRRSVRRSNSKLRHDCAIEKKLTLHENESSV